MLNWLDWQGRFLNNAADGKPAMVDADWVSIKPGSAPTRFRCIGVHRMTDAEAAGLCTAFVIVLGEDGERVVRPRIEFGWTAQAPDQMKPPVLLDKPPGEPQGNIDLWPHQITWLKVFGAQSDTVEGLLMSGDWRKEHNHNLHGGYLVVFQHGIWSGIPVPPVEPPVVPPAPEPPPTPPIVPGPGEPFDVGPVLAMLSQAAHAHQDANNVLIDAIQRLRDLAAAHHH